MLRAQFSDQTATVFAGGAPIGLADAAISWGDVNSDGYLDVVVSGSSSLVLNNLILYVYNPGSSQFAPAASNINLALSRGDLTFGDYDMDGKVDLAVMGADLLGTRYLNIYRNLGAAPYFASPIALPGVSDGSLDWGDMDNDGDLDLLVTGLTSTGAVTRIYQNTAGNFLELTQPLINPLGALTGVSQSDAAWGDYDNDGDLDILLNGLNLSGQPVVRLFRNLGNGAFENVVTSFSSLGLYDGSVAWGDYNNDGRLDVLLAGKQSGSGRLTTVYQNLGSGNFSFTSSSFPGIERGQAIWADLDNDGFTDVLLSGQDGASANNRNTIVYRNVNGTGVFAMSTAFTPAAAGGAAISVADYDLDRRLDVLYTGSTGLLANSIRLFRNTGSTGSTTAPASPTGLSAVQVGDTVVFTWTAPSAGLNYNLYVSSTSGADNRKAANSQLSNGFRRIVNLGNVNRVTTWKMVGFASGTYFWGVQSVDQRYQGSAFATGTSFTFAAPNPVTPVFNDVTGSAFSSAPPGVDQALLTWGDYDNDGDLDFVGSGSNSSAVVEAFAYRNNGNGTFTRDVSFSGLLNNNTFGMPLTDGQFAFGDFDGDGNLDLAAVGNNGATGVTTVFRNLGASFGYSFTFFSGANAIPNLGSSSVAWGDHDNDGDQDLLVMGITGATVVTEIYSYNVSTGAFVRDTPASASLPKVRAGRAAFADFDKDGFLDLAITGREDLSSAPFTRLYRNQGDGTFANFILTTQPQNLINSRVSWGDYNNDGYPDLLVCGNSNPSGSVLNTQLFLNLAGADFALQANVALTGIESGSAEWGDYNNDGFVDILLSGTTGTGATARITEVYQNNRQGGFVRDVTSSNNLQNLGNGSVAAWGDYDNDGKLDILITGNVSGVNSKSFRLYKNVQPTANLTPFPPQNIRSRLNGFAVELSWDLPQYSGTGPKINQGYTYNLYVKAAGSNTYLISPLADTTVGANDGRRRVARHGNASYTRFFNLENLSPGWYIWGVQAVDQDFEGSDFVRGRFYYDNPTFIPVMDANTFPFGAPEGFAKSDMAWGDYDDNGELDLVVTGESGLQAYNTQFFVQAGGQFVKDNAVTLTMPQVRNGSVDWGDFDNDGDLDLAISGETSSGNITRIYRRANSGFDPGFISLRGVRFSDLEWADFNNDGFLDLLVAGESASGLSVRVYVNNGAGAFGDTLSGFQGLRHAAVGWADYNLDGFQDFLITGENASGNPVTSLFNNNGRGGFSLSSIGFTGIRRGSVEWGDYNRDGFPDLIITGENTSGTAITQVWRNSSGTNFASGGTFPGVKEGQAALCDYNLDGYLDLLLAGQNGALISDRAIKLYAYRFSSSTFVEDTIAAAPFPRVNDGSRVRWADYDRDGRPDMVVTGSFGFGPEEKALTLFKNITTATPSRPNPPTGLSAAVSGYDITFTWTAPTVGVPANTTAGLTYNLYIGSAPGGISRKSPMAITGAGFNGWRKVAHFGRTAESTTWTWKNVPANGTYYWAVQAIDGDLEGSAFSMEQSVVFESPAFVDSTSLAFGNGGIGVSNAAMAWADFDKDGDMDLAVMGATAGGPVTSLYRNDGVGGFVKITGMPFRNLSSGSVSWTDFNLDQRPDLLLTGADSLGNAVTALYRNNGAGGFVAVTGAFSTGLKNSAAAWADYDRDGDEDVVILGEETGGTRRLWLYKNTGGNFAAPVSIGAGLRNGALAWGDYNRDGFPDLACAGDAATGRTALLLRNDRNGGFVDNSSGSNLPGLDEASLSWADFNRDGAVDLLFSGNSNSGLRTGVLRNTGNGTFVAVSITGLIPVRSGSAMWGDYDRDGHIDFAVTGITASGTAAQVFRNDQTGNFQAKDILALPLSNIGTGASMAWADYNGDDKLDLALAGLDNGGVRRLQLLKNVNTAAVGRLTAPTNLSFSTSADTVRLSWNAPAGASSATTYQVYLGTTAGVPSRLMPQAIPGTGKRLIPVSGQAGTSLSLPVLGLPAGTYFWSVQAIDQDFEGSPFATEASFTFVPPSFVNATPVTIPAGVPSGLDQAHLSWADVDGDGDLDLAAMGRTEAGGFASEVFLNTNGILSRSANASTDLPDARAGVMRWADADLDGDLDVYMSGEAAGGARVGALYLNSGAGRFTLDTASSSRLVKLNLSDAAWADFDQDGDPDLVVVGDSAANGAPARLACIRLYENVNGKLFRKTAWEVGLPAVYEGSVIAQDFDQNGNPDLVITGNTGTGLTADLFLGKGVGGGFAPYNAGITPVRQSSLSAADIDNDGFTDLLVTGDASATSTEQPLTQIYRYAPGSGQFVSAGANLLNVKEGSGAFADINDDGYPDVLISGKNGPGANDRSIKLYLNDQVGGMTEDVTTSTTLRAAGTGASIAMGDVNLDKKVDFALAGQFSATSPRKAVLIYRNQQPSPNFRYAAPLALDAIVSGDSVILTWNPPAQVAGAGLLPGLSYQVYVKSAQTGANVVSGEAILSGGSSGVRFLSAIGKQSHRTQTVLRGLATGKYYWSVQAVEPDFEGSPFAAADTFEYVRQVLIDASPVDMLSGTAGWDKAATAWADINRDGWLDLVLTGQTNADGFLSRVYLNESGKLRAQPGLEVNIPDVRSGAIAWGDMNQDGYVDLAIGGQTASGDVVRVYANEAGTGFQLVQNFGAVTALRLAWTDIDNDGDLDLAVAGEQGGAGRLTLFENRQEQGFATFNWSLPGLTAPAFVFEDFNLDGWDDLILSGRNSGTPTLYYFQNDTTGRLPSTPVSLSPALAGGNIHVADVNNDRRPDFVLTGTGSSGAETRVFLNQGSSFTQMSATLPGLSDGVALFADYNNDGYPDLLLAGSQASAPAGRTAQLYRNTQGTGFVPDALASAVLTPINGGVGAAWGDYNRDGKIDLVLAGMENDGTEKRHLSLYRNVEASPAVAPAPPVNLRTRIGDNFVELHWNRPSGQDSTLTKGYSYNLAVGKINDEEAIVSPESFLVNGVRMVASRGNAGSGNSIKLYDLPEGVYAWRVQSIDQDYEGSSFSVRDTFLFTPKSFEDKTLPVLGATLPAGLDNGSLLWVDTDRDGDLDLIVSGDLGSSNFSLGYYRNSGGVNARLTPVAGGIAFRDVALSHLRPVDFDRDGDEDILVMGRLEGSTQNRVFLLENDGNGNFSEETDFVSQLPALAEGALDIADMDQNGSPDLVMVGSRENGTPFTGLFLHTEEGWEPFTPAGDGLPPLKSASVAWYDYDRDGDSDLAMVGENAAGESFTGVYEQVADGEFRRKTGTNFEPVRRGNVTWADVDNDGFGDMIFTGESSAAFFEPFTRIYRYDSVSQLFNRIAPGLVNVSRGRVAAGDYDGDGWPDLIITGKNGAQVSDRTTRLYRNNQRGGFLEDANTSASLVDTDLSAAAWGDYDNDGRLDLALIGRSASVPITRQFRLYHNIDTTTAVVPAAPEDLEASLFGAEITLSWAAPASYPDSIAAGLTYNLWVGTGSEPFGLVAPGSDTLNGNRQVVHQGNIGHVTEYTFRKPPDGEYHWAVQAIDPQYQGSPFARGPEVLEYVNPIPDVTSEFYPPFRPTDSTFVTSFIQVNDTSYIDRVEVRYKGISEEAWRVEVVPFTGNRYRFQITAGKQDEQGTAYAYHVIGKYGFDAVTDTHYTYIRFVDTGLVVPTLKFGKRQGDYNLLSFPLELDDTKVANILEADEDFGKYNIYRWRFWDFENGDRREYTGGLTDVATGRGYWLITKKAAGFNTGAGVTVTANDDAPYLIPLKQGWNLIGNPYRFNLSWADVRAYNLTLGDTVEPVFTFTGINTESNRVDRFSGGWVFADQPYTLRIPVRKNPAVQREAMPGVLEMPSATVEEAEWTMPLWVEAGEVKNYLSGFGMRPDARVSRDAHDRINLPRLDQYAEVVFPHPEYFAPRFMRDIQPTDKRNVWEFEVQSNLEKEVVTLRWNPVVARSSARKMVLLDLDRQVVTDMAEAERYGFLYQDRPQRFKVLYGTAEEVAEWLKPEWVHIGDPQPNPFTGSVTAQVSIPESGSDFNVSYVIWDELGRKVATGNAGQLSAGFHEITWDGVDNQGNAVATGLYLMQVSVSGGGQSTQKTLRILKQ